MTQPKQVKTLLFSLLAIFCVTAAWLWLTRSPAAQVMATNPVPSVGLPAPTGSAPAPNSSPVSAAPPAVLATAPERSKDEPQAKRAVECSSTPSPDASSCHVSSHLRPVVGPASIPKAAAPPIDKPE